MGRKELIKAILIVLVILSLTIQRITAATRYSKVWSTPTGTKKKPLEMEDDPGDDAAGDDYDFYRRHGSVPSPGVGH